ncbi:hypothetical protein LTR95_003560 [Oleoguttula sp. CCFEE 5521]
MPGRRRQWRQGLLYIVGRTEEKLVTVVRTYSKDIAGSLQHIVADEEHVDIPINNAGISTATFNTKAGSAKESKKALFDNEEATFANWSAAYRNNVSQIYFMTTCFLPLLHPATEKAYGWRSTVINICSISAQVKTTQHHPQYDASKAATIHQNRVLANEIQENGLKIRVNSIAPGVFLSEMTAGESGAN